MVLQKLHPQLQAFVREKWKGLTDIQEKAFDPIYNGLSCTIEAPTSGGKTEAVLFPLLSRIKPDKHSGFKVLYIAPLKALLNDLAIRVVPYAKKCYMDAFKWHGDVSQDQKVQQMVFPSDILLTTPESIEAILLRKPNWKEVFASLETVVIDEAHYFANTERGSHLVSLLERIDDEIKKKPQRIAVTATIGNPEDLLQWILGDRANGLSIRVDTKNTKERDFLIHYFNEDGQGLQPKLYQLLGRKKSIVFERSRSDTEDTAARINDFNRLTNSHNHIKVATHHSSISKLWREQAEERIKQKSESSLDAIISTSTLELGIDIGELDQVIQIGGLNSPGSFLQRVGRTGRRPGKPQYFRGLCADEEELLLLAACVSLGWKRTSESILFPNRAFHILAHQVICLCLQKMGATAEEIWQILSKASCFSKITSDEFRMLIDYMVENDYLRSVGRGALLTGAKTEEVFLRANWKRLFAIFDTSPMYNVVDGKKLIGTLDFGFAQTLKLPFVFVLGGQEWNALKLDHEMQQVLVEKNKTGKAPKWKALANYDIPFELAQEVGTMLMSEGQLHFLDPTAFRVIQSQRNMRRGLCWQRDRWILEAESAEGPFSLWTFAGDKMNRTISMLFAAEFGELPDYDFMSVTFQAQKGQELSKEQCRNWLSQLRTSTITELESLINTRIEVKWFSKFSDCLPEKLAKRAIQEKAMDTQGLMRELKKTDVVMNNERTHSFNNRLVS
jgi:ATP-dependent Lhr-like helicase